MSENLTPMSRQQRRARERNDRKDRMGGTLSKGTMLTLGAALAAVPAAQAATFTVTNLNDSGAGSLRQAITDANNAAGADIVAFQAGLTGTITLTSGQLVVSDSVDIQGPGAAALTVSGNAAGRSFYLYSGAALLDVTISGLTITGGGGVTFGAAIIDFGENLVLDGVTITGNTATAGGGGLAATDLTGDGMSLTVRDSTISGNDSGRDGGAIYFYTTGGPMLIENSVISGNDAVDDGGGIYLYNVTDNLTVTGSTISGNTAGGTGGGIYFYQTDGGVQTIDHSTLSGNSAYLGGGMFWVFGDTPITIDHSTFSGNDATAGGALFSAFAFGSTVTVVDSTISGNEATSGDGGGLFFYALYAGGSVAIRNSTIASNTGTGAFSLTGPIPVSNSILGDNTPADLGTDLDGNFALSFSLLENAGTANVTDSGGNVLGQDPQLGPLANNGGPTQTHKPAATSPAVNAGNPAFVPPPSTDQRDMPRVVGTQIDMGSVELGLPGTIQLTFSTTSVGEAAGTVTVTATRTGGSEGAVSVSINTANGTAVAPADYGAVVGGTLSWADGDTAPKSLNITIVNDLLDEPDETFTVTISSPTGGATLGSPATATITIVDDDLAPLPPLEIPTVGEWGLVFLSGLLAMAGLYRLRRKQGLAAPMLILTLAAGASVVNAATPAVPTKAAQGVRDLRAVTLSQVSARQGMVTLQLSDGFSVQVSSANLEIKDRRGRAKLGVELQLADLTAGQPVVVKVHRNPAGVIKKVRVQVFDTLDRAQAALQRHQQ